MFGKAWGLELHEVERKKAMTNSRTSGKRSLSVATCSCTDIKQPSCNRRNADKRRSFLRCGLPYDSEMISDCQDGDYVLKPSRGSSEKTSGMVTNFSTQSDMMCTLRNVLSAVCHHVMFYHWLFIHCMGQTDAVWAAKAYRMQVGI